MNSMDMLNQIQGTMANLLNAGVEKLKFLNRILDPERIAQISQTHTRREEALLALGLEEKDLIVIEEEKAGKREFIRRAIARSNPSFGRFLTEAYVHYETTKNPKAQSRISKVDSLEKLQQELNT